MMFIWIIGVIVIIYLLVDNDWLNKVKGNTNSKEPLQILKERLARGEITQSEFNQLKDELDN